jgi:hypothetical protein
LKLFPTSLQIQAVFEAVSNKLASGEPIKDFGNDEAAYFAKDIQYMFDVARTLDRHS